MVQITIEPGESFFISKDIYRDQTLIFRAGDPVTILEIRPDTQMPDYKYVAQSSYNGGYYQLRDVDLTLRSTQVSNGQPWPSNPGAFPASANEATRTTPPGNNRIRKKRHISLTAWLGLFGLMLFFIVSIVYGILQPREGTMLDNVMVTLMAICFIIFIFVAVVYIATLGNYLYIRIHNKWHDSSSEKSWRSIASRISFPTGHEKHLCWRCLKDNDKNATSCSYCENPLGVPLNTGMKKYSKYYWTFSAIIVLSIFTRWALLDFGTKHKLDPRISFFNANSAVPIKELFDLHNGYFIASIIVAFSCIAASMVCLYYLSNKAGFQPDQKYRAFGLLISPLASIGYVHVLLAKKAFKSVKRDESHYWPPGMSDRWDHIGKQQVDSVGTVDYFDSGKPYRWGPSFRIRTLKLAIQNDGLNHRLRYYLAKEYFAKGNIKKGFDELNRALELSPDNQQYLELMTLVESA